MKNILEKQDAIIADFDMMGDDFGKYAYLVELSGQLPGMNEERKTDANLVKGCQSHVWLDSWVEDGQFYFCADSDTLIIKGILFLLQDVLCGQPVKDVAEAQLDFLQKTNIMVTFNADRQRGIGYVIRAIQEKAGAAGLTA